MADQILSQEEIDALLTAMDSGDVEFTEEKEEVKAAVKSYDLTSQGAILRDQFDALEEVYDKMIGLLTNTFTTSLHRAIDVKIVSKEMVKFGEFLQAFSNPTGLCIFSMEPLIGLSLLAVEPGLLFSLIDCMFGGEGKPIGKIREFTFIEQRMLKKIGTDFLKEMERAWEIVYPISISFKKIETKPEFVNIVNPSDLMIILVVSISSDEFSGNIHLCIPYMMLEPIKEKLSSSYLREKDLSNSFREELRHLLMDTRLKLVAELGETEQTVKNILDLEVNDIIRLNSGPQDRIILKVEEIPKYFGTPGVIKGNRALQIVELIENTGAD